MGVLVYLKFYLSDDKMPCSLGEIQLCSPATQNYEHILLNSNYSPYQCYCLFIGLVKLAGVSNVLLFMFLGTINVFACAGGMIVGFAHRICFSISLKK